MSVFDNLGGAEYLPDSLTYRTPTKENFVLGRTTQRWTPTSGSTYSGLNSRTITFRLNSSEMAAPESFYLNMQLRTPKTYVVPEDLAPISILSSVRLTVGGSQAEYYTNAGTALKPLIYHSASADFLSGNASVALGSWLYRPTVGFGLQSGSDANTITPVVNSDGNIGGTDYGADTNSLGKNASFNYNYMGSTYRANSFVGGFEAALTTATKFTGRSVNGIDFNGRNYSIPLALILGLFRTEQLLPLRSMGAVELTLELNPPNRCLIVCAPATVGTEIGGVLAVKQNQLGLSSDAPENYVLDYTLTNLSITGDLVSISPAAAAKIDSLTAGEDGISLVVDTFATTLFPTQQGGASQQSLVCTRPYSNLTAQWVTMQPSAGVASPYWNKSNFYSGSRFQSCQTQIGGLSFPAQAITSTSQAWLELRKSLTRNGVSLEKGTAVGWHAYNCQYPSPYGPRTAASRGTAPDIRMITNTPALTNLGEFSNGIMNMPPACFVIGQSFSRVLSSGDSVSLSGINSRLSGYSAQTNLQFTPFVASPNNSDPLANPACSMDSALFDTPMDYLVTQSVSVLLRLAMNSVMVSD
jgi:hypothetical protein